MGFFKVVGRFLSKNSPVIFAGLAVGGVATTSILTAKATKKAVRAIEILEEELGYKPSNKEIAAETWKLYIPAAVSGVSTITSIVLSQVINAKRLAAVSGLYSIAQDSLIKYSQKVIEQIGPKKEQNLKDSVIKDAVAANPPPENILVVDGKGSTLCCDSLSKRYFYSDIEKIKQAINEINRRLLIHDYISLNEMYYELGLSGSELGDLMGWHVEQGLIENVFSSQLTENGTPCLVLVFRVVPKYAD